MAKNNPVPNAFNQVLATLRYDARHKATGNTIDSQSAELLLAMK